MSILQNHLPYIVGNRFNDQNGDDDDNDDQRSGTVIQAFVIQAEQEANARTRQYPDQRCLTNIRLHHKQYPTQQLRNTRRNNRLKNDREVACSRCPQSFYGAVAHFIDRFHESSREKAEGAEEKCKVAGQHALAERKQQNH